ncbi:36891_t:CDS:2 [Gigaspora margarita]|uniref:36891_t:CDS:1 n=1 Tax=Gigaspora margarita TaxID=4874 RepID=A0ABN7V4H5_GIGMA|nr:36891_t:CDS:2 [Gigaspora margarita]
MNKLKNGLTMDRAPPTPKINEPVKTHTAPRSILKTTPYVHTTHLTPNGDKSMHSYMSKSPRPLSPTNSSSPQSNVSNTQFQYKVEQQTNSMTQPLVQKPTNINTQNLPSNIERRSPAQYASSPTNDAPIQYSNHTVPQRSHTQYSNHSASQWPHNQYQSSPIQYSFNATPQGSHTQHQSSPTQYLNNAAPQGSHTQHQSSPTQYSNNAASQWSHTQHQNSPTHYLHQNSSQTFKRQNSAESSSTQNSHSSSYSSSYSSSTPMRQGSTDSSSTQNSQGHSPRLHVDSEPELQCASKLMHRMKSLRSSDTPITSSQNIDESVSMGQPTTVDDYISQAIKYHENDQLEKSTEYFHIAAQQNNTIGMIFYGLALRHGWGCKTDTAKGFKYLQRAADSATGMLNNINDTTNSQILKTGLVLAIYELGMCYKHGWGVPKDKAKAAHYYRMAADQGDPDAQNDIALCYYKGEGVKKDMKIAAKYYRMADKQGYGTMGNSWIYKEKYNY